MSWRAHLPRAADRRIAVRATPDAIRQVRGGSPWLFDGSITSVSHEGDAGDLAVVFDDRRNFVADRSVGSDLADPGQGPPRRFTGRRSIGRGGAVACRLRSSGGRSLAADDTTTAYRCVHGENDGLPGLVVDRYDSTLVVKLYSSAWFSHLADVVDALGRVAGTRTDRVAAVACRRRLRHVRARARARSLIGEAPTASGAVPRARADDGGRRRARPEDRTLPRSA